MSLEYYKKREMALRVIDKMIAAKRTELEIIYHVESTFGFGERLVKKRIDLLKALSEERNAEATRNKIENNSEGLPTTDE